MAEVGRPRIELTDEQVELIENLAGLGLTQGQIAHCLPMSERTLRDRINAGDDPEISAAYARGRAEDVEDLSSRHRKIARGEITDTPVSEQRKALEWRLERQHKWAGRQEITGADGKPIQVEDLSSDEVQERKAHLANRIAALQQSENGKRNGAG